MKLYMRGSVPVKYARPWKVHNPKKYSMPRLHEGPLVPGLRKDQPVNTNAIGFVDFDIEEWIENLEENKCKNDPKT